jgi:NAD-dependent deacetylase
MEIDDLIARLKGHVLVFTGAGISVASGLPTFRGAGGLYEGKNPYELATPEAFRTDPVTVWNWYLMRIHQGKGAQPNAAHRALVDLESIANRVTIVTSNVDPLHQRAGSTRVFRLHGDILETKCTSCGRIEPLELASLPERVDHSTLFRCSCGGIQRPNVVWFGERPWEAAFDAVREELPGASVVLEIGHSGVVSYGFTELAVHLGIPVIRINPEGPDEPGVTWIEGAAEDVLPGLVLAARGM